jgi:hypothetical protein
LAETAAAAARGGIYIVDTAVGGAIISFNNAILIVDHCNFSGNEALAGSNATSGTTGQGMIGLAVGGALFNLGAATVTNSTFNGNIAQGGSGNADTNGDLRVGSGAGGAITNNPFFDGTGGTLNVGTCTLTNNQARGGSGNSGGLLSNDGIGGALANQFGATATLTSTTFTDNQAVGGSGADSLGGALANLLGSTLSVSGCTLSGNQATGGAGGLGANGGNGFGGGLYNDGTSALAVAGSAITNNSATGGAASGGGSAGQGAGGGAYFAAGGTVCLDAFTVANIVGNTASTGDNNVFGGFTIC